MPQAFVRLDGADCSLVLDCRGPGIPRCLHWGARLAPDLDPQSLDGARARLRQNAVLDHPPPVSLLPEAGLGFFGVPGLEGHRGPRDWATAFELRHVDEGPQRLSLALADPTAGLALELEITLHPDSGVISRRSSLRNEGAAAPYCLNWLAAAAFALPEDAEEAMLLHGAWSTEFSTRRVGLEAGQVVQENRRGRTSHHHFPGCFVGQHGFDDLRGTVFGFHLAWSGNHRLLIDRQAESGRQLQLGELLLPGEIILEPGENYRSPWVHAAWSPEGAERSFAALSRLPARRDPAPGRGRPSAAGTLQFLGGDLLRPPRGKALCPRRTGRRTGRGTLRPRRRLVSRPQQRAGRAGGLAGRSGQVSARARSR